MPEARVLSRSWNGLIGAVQPGRLEIAPYQLTGGSSPSEKSCALLGASFWPTGHPMVLCLAALGDADWRLIGMEV